jgi:hypothetical protein
MARPGRSRSFASHSGQAAGDTFRFLKPVAAKRIHATGFKVLHLCLSLSQNRCTLFGRHAPKPVETKRIHATGFRLFSLCMSLSQNRCVLLGDMHQSPSRRNRFMRRALSYFPCACRCPKTAAHFWGVHSRGTAFQSAFMALSDNNSARIAIAASLANA